MMGDPSFTSSVTPIVALDAVIRAMKSAAQADDPDASRRRLLRNVAVAKQLLVRVETAATPTCCQVTNTSHARGGDFASTSQLATVAVQCPPRWSDPGAEITVTLPSMASAEAVSLHVRATRCLPYQPRLQDTAGRLADRAVKARDMESQVWSTVPETGFSSTPRVALNLTTRWDADLLDASKRLRSTPREVDLRCEPTAVAGIWALGPVLSAATQLLALQVEASGLGMSCKLGSDGAAALARVVGGQPKLERLSIDLRGNTIGDDGAQAVAAGFAACSGLQVLCLGLDDNCVGAIGSGAVGHAIACLSRLRRLTLGLSSNPVHPPGAIPIGQALARSVRLQSLVLQLSDTEIGDRGAHAIGLGLAHNPSLVELDISISRSVLGLSGWTDVGRGIRQCRHLAALAVSCDDDTDSNGNCIKALLEALSTAVCISSLRLSSSGSAACGVVAAVPSLPRSALALELLLGNHTTAPGVASVDMLADGLSGRELVQLSLDLTGQNLRGIKRFAAGSWCAKLVKLVLAFTRNHLVAVSMKELSSSLEQCRCLRDLSLRLDSQYGPGIGDLGARHLAVGLSRCVGLSVIELDMSGAGVRAKGVLALVVGLQRCEQLQGMDVQVRDGRFLSSSQERKLVLKLAQCHRLEDLCFVVGSLRFACIQSMREHLAALRQQSTLAAGSDDGAAQSSTRGMLTALVESASERDEVPELDRTRPGRVAFDVPRGVPANTGSHSALRSSSLSAAKKRDRRGRPQGVRESGAHVRPVGVPVVDHYNVGESVTAPQVVTEVVASAVGVGQLAMWEDSADTVQAEVVHASPEAGPVRAAPLGEPAQQADTVQSSRAVESATKSAFPRGSSGLETATGPTVPILASTAIYPNADRGGVGGEDWGNNRDAEHESSEWQAVESETAVLSWPATDPLEGAVGWPPSDPGPEVAIWPPADSAAGGDASWPFPDSAAEPGSWQLTEPEVGAEGLSTVERSDWWVDSAGGDWQRG
mmetsp:Transcript_104667/g.239965  ORF Transcript_104667/g.239965 Transcript_104667/m.239965 type:complete len:989 (+) Transcript_104667:18-2984(+)